MELEAVLGTVEQALDIGLVLKNDEQRCPKHYGQTCR
jgi:hypothetical protein